MAETETSSRRERPWKDALTRERIVETALEILRNEGIDRVTMRRVATALETGPASLYVYFRDAGDLHADILDALLADLRHVRPRGTWRDKLAALLEDYMALLFAHPAMARMAMTTMPSGSNYLALVDRILGLLAEGQVADREAAWAVDLLLLHATATAAEQGERAASGTKGDQFARVTAAIQRAEPARYPHVARLGDELMSGGGDRMRWQIDLILNGVLATPRPVAKKAKKQR